MDIERQFEDLGVDAITGIQLMRSLNISPDDFLDSSRFLRFKDVIDYFKNIPDREYILNKVTIGKNVDKLDHIWGYTQLSKQKEDLRNHIDSEMKRLDIINSLGDEMQHDSVKFIESKIMDRKIELSKINEQIDKYEA